MKEQVQQTGVRKWYGDDWLDIQNELMNIMEGHFGHFGKQFIVSGCTVAATTISAGIVALNTEDGFKLCRFEGATGILFPAYLKPQIVEDTRLYLDGDVKPVTKSYNAVVSSTNNGSYLQLKQDNTTDRFTDIIQDGNHRFVNDDQIAGWNGAVGSALSTIRGGIISNLNTLEKLRAYMQEEINNIDTGDFDVNEIYTTIRGGIADELNTLKKLHGSITGAYVRDLLSQLTDVNRLDASAIKNLSIILSATEIRDKLQELEGSEKLDASAIKYLEVLDVQSSTSLIGGEYHYRIATNKISNGGGIIIRIKRKDQTDTSITTISETIYNEKIAELEARLDALGG